MNFRIDKFISRFKDAVTLLLFPKRYYIYPQKSYSFHQMSFSQEGEDIILSRLLAGEKEQGFYVDVGAHHPQRFSNTYYFYLKGWRGINIDPLPGSKKEFQEMRPLDFNIEVAVSDVDEELTYYQFNESALNTFSEKLAKDRVGLSEYQLIGKKKIVTKRLEEILDQYLPSGQIIDFLSVDVEGFDLRVLKSNNWEKYRPKVVLVEDLQQYSYKELRYSSLVTYLDRQGYELYSKALYSMFFCQKADQ